MGGTEYADRFVALRVVIGWSPGQDASTRPQFLVVTVDPNGVVSAPRGSLATREDVGNVNLYENIDGAMAWTAFGGSAVASALRTIEIVIPAPAAPGTYDSVTALPAGSRVYRTQVNIGTAFNGGKTMTVSQAGGPVLMTTTMITEQTANSTSIRDQRTPIVANGVARVVIAGAAGVGDAVVTVFYATPAT